MFFLVLIPGKGIVHICQLFRRIQHFVGLTAAALGFLQYWNHQTAIRCFRSGDLFAGCLRNAFSQLVIITQAGSDPGSAEICLTDTIKTGDDNVFRDFYSMPFQYIYCGYRHRLRR